MINKQLHIIFLVAVSTCAVASPVKWTDANGTIHYSDRSPAGVQTQPLPTPPPPSSSALITQPSSAPSHDAQFKPPPKGTSANYLLELKASNFAKIDDIAAVPYLNKHGRDNYGEFLSSSGTRAFLICPNGASIILTSQIEGRLIMNGEFVTKNDCKPYAVNDSVVWTGK